MYGPMGKKENRQLDWRRRGEKSAQPHLSKFGGADPKHQDSRSFTDDGSLPAC
jgi:hypothetical protein